MPFIEIDVAKAQFEFACLPSGETGTVPNEDGGIRELVARCQALAPALIVLERHQWSGTGAWARC
jgi:hypothetical protein